MNPVQCQRNHIKTTSEFKLYETMIWLRKRNGQTITVLNIFIELQNYPKFP